MDQNEIEIFENFELKVFYFRITFLLHAN